MTEAEKQAECLRICGPNVTPEMHSMAPVMCPVLWDIWRTKKPSFATFSGKGRGRDSVKTGIIIVLLAIAGLGYGQTAKVVQLSPEDAAKAKHLYEVVQAAQKALDDFHVDVGNRYVSHAGRWPMTACATICTTDGKCSTCTPPKLTPQQEKDSHGFLFNDGWEVGFEYSEDFKAIVPRRVNLPAVNSPSCWTVNPAFGVAATPAYDYGTVYNDGTGLVYGNASTNTTKEKAKP